MVALPLILLLLGVCEFGRLLWVRQGLERVAIAGARCVGMGVSSCQVSGAYDATATQTYIVSEAANWRLTLAGSNVAVTTSTTCGNVTGMTQVTLSYTFQTVIPGLLPVIASGDQISASACFPNAAVVAAGG
jgi:Flp pilus assembly protein TadG